MDKRIKVRFKKHNQTPDYDDHIISPLDDYEEPEIIQSKNERDMEIMDKLISMSNFTNKSDEDEKKEKKKKKSKDKKKDKDKKKKKKKDKNQLDISSLGLFTDEPAGGVLPPGAKDPKKKMDKSNENFYEFRFGASLMLLRDILGEVNNLTNESKDYLDKLKKGLTGTGGARTRVTPTAITNQTANLVSLYGTKLNIIKELTGVNKNISDLELKKMAQDAKEKANEVNPEDNSKFLIDQMFDKLSAGERIAPSKSKKKRKKKDSDKELAEVIKDLEKSGEIEYSDNEKAFKYESRSDIKVVIKLYVATDEWEFEAVDNDDEIVEDYPLPNKLSVGNIKFEKDKDTPYATDELGNSYELRFVR